ncbi:helix-turn-helix domain-containing protein [Parashewanella spongiae]|uniref:DNA-3-methyladenine glycosylase 2 family protein n=1 Tax=Parashewanella spongiae TaxID=342950 RepID=UPI001FB4F23C|nr:AlkA N-terminal domain-containing protein [Parashewanella spongiae]MCL1077699.1 helix-turn-helix domain-containing protein [Parashewanella spongiae]
MIHAICEATKQNYQQARLSRDPRFDGLFFIGVKTTGIYCRSICPAVAPKEENIDYYHSAIAAAQVGLRPCLRCRPDSAPHSYAWKGVKTTLERAIKLIDYARQNNQVIEMEHLAERLGITSRYLRKLFQDQFGTSPKQFMQYQQLLFAKTLLHQTKLSITDIALISGFHSVRNFNQIFKQKLLLTPSQFRKGRHEINGDQTKPLQLYLSYRPPFNWDHMRAFLSFRAVPNMEWLPDDNTYVKTFSIDEMKGYFVAEHQAEKYRFKVKVFLSDQSNLSSLYKLVANIRRILDLDADMQQIDEGITHLKLLGVNAISGLRVVGTGSVFEGLCRAVLGQQVSVKQAINLLTKLVHHYGDQEVVNGKTIYYFPEPQSLSDSDFEMLKMPGARKLALRSLAAFLRNKPNAEVEECLDVKGIGPWTVEYAKMRGLSDPNVFLATDLVVRKRLMALLAQENSSYPPINTNADYGGVITSLKNATSPWCSYVTFQLWNLQ